MWGGSANGDGDLLNNDQEYYFRGNPKDGNNVGAIGLSPVTGGNVLITFVRRKNDPSLTYTLQGSVSLTPPAWMNVQPLVIHEAVSPIDEAFEHVTLTIQMSEAGPIMFFRVIVTQ